MYGCRIGPALRRFTARRSLSAAAAAPTFEPDLSRSSTELVELHDQLQELVADHFRAPIRYAVAYGSGVFPQKGYSPEKVLFYGPVGRD